MHIGLIDVDGHNLPNFALMKLSAWHKAHGDKVEWCGEESDEIVTTEDGEKCIDCIEEEKFYQETMKGI